MADSDFAHATVNEIGSILHSNHGEWLSASVEECVAVLKGVTLPAVRRFFKS